MKIRPVEWKPQGLDFLEPVADRIVRADSNMAVLAGPGAGKTETLAQRACYLLQTGLCPTPRKVLAVSYKRDSARVLRKRVQMRCPEESWRFHSVTFDSFAKHILDRFIRGLARELQPGSDYLIEFPKPQEVEDYLRFITLPESFGASDLVGLSGSIFLNRHFCRHPNMTGDEPRSAEEYASRSYFFDLLRSSPSRLTFSMICWLARAALNSNPKLLEALRDCFSHVFLDEFQDTSSLQYDLLLACFKGTEAVLTAVGDDKQRIMTFAGAMPDSFVRFQADFNASLERPVINYRSAPELILILQVLARAVEANGVDMQPAPKAVPGGHCEAIVYPDPDQEALDVADTIRKWIHEELVLPGDICVLCKQVPNRYAAKLVEALEDSGVHCRIESGTTADFLEEDFSVDALSLLRLSVLKRSQEDFTSTILLLENLKGVDPENREAGQLLRRELTMFMGLCRDRLESFDGSETEMLEILNLVLSFFGVTAYKAANPQYAQGSLLKDTVSKISKHLASLRARREGWIDVIDEALGRNVVTVTTIHKSKGREYDSVVFLGLEDGAFWNFQSNVEEETRTFFVAFSRAKKRVRFTHAAVRDGRIGSISKISPLYDLLESAGVSITYA